MLFRELLPQEFDNISYQALISTFNRFPQKPDVNIDNNLGRINRRNKITKEQRIKEDTFLVNGFLEEIKKENVEPDETTLYILDIGLPHVPYFVYQLRLRGIDSYVYTSPSSIDISSNLNYYLSYRSSYEFISTDLEKVRMVNPLGYALFFNGHSDEAEDLNVQSILPSVFNSINNLGIRRIVLCKETYYDKIKPNFIDTLFNDFF